MSMKDGRDKVVEGCKRLKQVEFRLMELEDAAHVMGMGGLSGKLLSILEEVAASRQLAGEGIREVFDSQFRDSQESMGRTLRACFEVVEKGVEG